MLENRQGDVDIYMQVFPYLLVPILWDRPGNIPPLVRLLQAYIEKASAKIEDEKIVSNSNGRKLQNLNDSETCWGTKMYFALSLCCVVAVHCEEK
jgi:hypothetical protein